MNAIEIDQLKKAYSAHLGRSSPLTLGGLTLQVPENKIFGFLGRNGAGKTTTIKCLCGLIRPTGGTAQVFGVDVRKRKARKMIGYLPENPYFYEYLTPRETMNFFGLLAGLSSAERAKEWERLSALFDLEGIADRRVRELSKGMRQRLGFAVAMVGDPRVLILDEPMSGLDPLVRRKFREVILYAQSQGTTVFFSSHVLADVQQICDRVAILHKGELVVEGRMSDLLGRRINEFEVILSDVDESLQHSLSGRSDRMRRSEDGFHYHFSASDAANDAVREALRGGAKLVEFIPVRESLEDYFVRLDSGASR